MTSTMTLQEARARVSVFERDLAARQQVLWLECRSALGEWLGTFPWDYFVTLTFTYQPKIETAVSNFRRWVRRLEQQAKERVDWAYVLDYGQAGLWHFHVFVHCANHLLVSEPRKAWTLSWPEMPWKKLMAQKRKPRVPYRIGRIDASRYDPELGASYYLANKVGDEVVEWDFKLPVAEAALH